MVPNHPRYQLRYTRLFDFAVLSLFRPSMVGHVVKCCAGEIVRGENARVFKAFRASVLGAVEPKSKLPNHALYHLSYTRIFNFSAFCRCGQTCGQTAVFGDCVEKGKCENRSDCKGLRDRGFPAGGRGVTRPQTTRATNCAIPGQVQSLYNSSGACASFFRRKSAANAVTPLQHNSIPAADSASRIGRRYSSDRGAAF